MTGGAEQCSIGSGVIQRGANTVYAVTTVQVDAGLGWTERRLARTGNAGPLRRRCHDVAVDLAAAESSKVTTFAQRHPHLVRLITCYWASNRIPRTPQPSFSPSAACSVPIDCLLRMCPPGSRLITNWNCSYRLRLAREIGNQVITVLAVIVSVWSSWRRLLLVTARRNLCTHH